MKFAYYSPNRGAKIPLKNKIFMALGIALALVLLFAFTFTVVLVALAGGILVFILNLFSGRQRKAAFPSHQDYPSSRPQRPPRQEKDDDIIDI